MYFFFALLHNFGFFLCFKVMAKRLCVRSAQWSKLFVELGPLLELRDRASLTVVCRAFTEPFRGARCRLYDAGPLFGPEYLSAAEDITACLADPDGTFEQSIEDDTIEWPLERERWASMVKMIRELDFRAKHEPPRLFDQMPVFANLTTLNMVAQPWFFAMGVEKMPNLTRLTLNIYNGVDELDFTGWQRLRRLSLRNHSTKDVISIDLSPATRSLDVDPSFFIRSGQERVEQLTVTESPVPFYDKFVLSAPKWVALTKLVVTTSSKAYLDIPDGPLPVPDCVVDNEDGNRALAEVCQVERLKRLFLSPGRISDALAFPGEQLVTLEELTLELPHVLEGNPDSLAPLVAVRHTLKRLAVWANVSYASVSYATRLKGHWDISHVGRLTHLESLALRTSQKPCFVELRHLKRCKSLRHLTLHGLLLNFPKPRPFELSNLETLSVTPVTLKEFLRLTKLLPDGLQRLTLGCTLARPDSTNSLFQGLGLFKRLEWLDLRETQYARSLIAMAKQSTWFPPTCALLT